MSFKRYVRKATGRGKKRGRNRSPNARAQAAQGLVNNPSGATASQMAATSPDPFIAGGGEIYQATH